MTIDYEKGIRPNVYELMQGGGGGYELPTATAETLGGVKIGVGVDVAEDGTISVTAPAPADTYTKAEIDAQQATQDANITANTQAVSDLETALDDTYDKTEIDAQQAAQNANISENRSAISNIETHQQQQDTNITANAIAILSVTTDIAAIVEQQQTQNAKIAINTANINALQSTVSNFYSKAEIDSQQQAQDANISANTSAIGNINSRVATAEIDIETIEGQQQTQDANIAANAADISANTSAISDLSDDLDALSSTVATDSTLGLIKTDSEQLIETDATGKLIVKGRLGETADLGLYNPIFADPVAVGRFSFLMTEAKGLTAAHRELIIAGGSGLTLKTAAQAGATEYRVSNTQQNRFVAACFVGNGSVLTLDEAYAKEKTVPIVSCKFANGDDVTAYFGATETSNDIIITTSESINPDSSITAIRCYGSWANSDTISAGQGNRTGGSKTLQIGQALFTGANNNQVLQLGNRQYSTRNNVLMIGNDLISKKQFWALIGQGHDNTLANDGGAAFGVWSEITPNTKLALGNGTSHSARSNLFEVTEESSGGTGIVIKSPNNTAYKITVSDNGNLTVTAV